MATNPRRAPALLAAGLLAATALPALAQSSGDLTLNKVTFQGNQQVSTAELQAALPIQPGQKVDHAGLQAETAAVQAVYQKHNVGASITARMTVSHHDRADVTYIFAEQAPVAPTVQHIGITADTVGVSGNSKISTADILAAAGIHPGDGVTNEKLAAAQNAIVALYKKANIGATVGTDWTNGAQPQHINLVFKIGEKADTGPHPRRAATDTSE